MAGGYHEVYALRRAEAIDKTGTQPVGPATFLPSRGGAQRRGSLAPAPGPVSRNRGVRWESCS